MMWGFDIATRSTGWCAGDGSGRPVLGAFQYQHVNVELGRLAVLWEEDLDRLALRFGKPRVVAYEKPILTPRDTCLPLRKIYGMGMQLERWCLERGVLCVEVSLYDIKLRVAGRKKAEKDELVHVVRDKLQIAVPEGEQRKDACDAFGAWLCGCVDHYAKEHRPRWDAALYGQRGALL